jgi:hypothetical protein
VAAANFIAAVRHNYPWERSWPMVRRALLIDTARELVVSPITESIQLRKYLEIPPQFAIDFNGNMQ